MSNNGKRLRNWLFTMFLDRGGLALDAASEYGALLDGVDNIRCGVWQLECCPESSRLHLQGYVEFDCSVRMAHCKSIFGSTVHLEGRKGSRSQAIEYCRKRESRVGGPWTIGDLDSVKPGARTDLHDLAERINGGAGRREVVDDFGHLYIRYSRGVENLLGVRAMYKVPEWRELETVVYYGDAGTGKTRRAVEASPGDYFILQSGERVWFDGYEGEGTLIIDDFYGWIRYGLLLSILDGYKLRLEVKGGFTYANWTKVFITSNDAPASWYQKGLTPALKRRLTKIEHFNASFQ